MRLSLLIVALAGCEPDGVTFEPNTTAPIGDDDDDDTGFIGSGIGMVCDATEEDGTCTLYTGSSWDLGTAQQECFTGTFYPSAFCPRATLGECTFNIGMGSERVISYYLGVWYDPGDEEAVEGNCEGLGEGSWSTASDGGT
jgi:hypothetical protein